MRVHLLWYHSLHQQHNNCNICVVIPGPYGTVYVLCNYTSIETFPTNSVGLGQPVIAAPVFVAMFDVFGSQYWCKYNTNWPYICVCVSLYSSQYDYNWLQMI